MMIKILCFLFIFCWGFCKVDFRLGSIIMNDEHYTEFSVKPLIKFGEFEACFDFAGLFDKKWNIREEDWDDWQDWVNKIEYIKYRRDFFSLKLGGIEDLTLANGFIVKDYTNRENYPQIKKLGCEFFVGKDLNFKGFVSDLFGYKRERIVEKFVGTMSYQGQTVDVYYKWKEEYLDKIDVYGARVGYKKGIFDCGLSFSQDLQKDILIYGVDLGCSMRFLKVYSDWAKISGYGQGIILPGILLKYKGFFISIERRTLDSNFIPSYFDSIYNLEGVSENKKESLKKQRERKESLFGECGYSSDLLLAKAFYHSLDDAICFSLRLNKRIFKFKDIEFFISGKLKERFSLDKRNKTGKLRFEYLLAGDNWIVITQRFSYDAFGKLTTSFSVSTNFSF